VKRRWGWGRSRGAVRARLPGLLSAILLNALPALAQEEGSTVYATPDSVFEAESQPGPSYQTVYDRDNNRNNWQQSLSYFRSTGRIAVSGSGSVTTQEFTQFANKSTFGEFGGHVDARLTRRWVVSLDGRFEMYSSTDGTRNADSRGNQLQVRTQYNLNPLHGMTLTGVIYTAFQQDHGKSVQQRVDPAFPEVDPTAVDSLRVQRDSSYTTARQDGLNGVVDWRVKPWLSVNATVSGSRVRPTQTSLIRDFTQPLDGSGGGYVIGTADRTREPRDNATYTSRLTFTRLPRTSIDLNLSKSALDQSMFDKQLRGQERTSFDRSSGMFHLQHGPYRNFHLTVDGSLVRSEREYVLRRNYTSLLKSRQLTSGLAYGDSITRGYVGLTVSRSRNERQASGNGLLLNRLLNANAYRKISGRLALDAMASASIQISKYADPRSDQDVARTSVNVGGGYRISPSCSTTVHFSTTRSHSVFLDPSASSTNAVQTNYQLNATLRLRVSEEFTVWQDYVLNADYKIFDFTEPQNVLNRVRRIDTNLADTLFSFAYLRLTHNFSFRDQGTYTRDPGEAERAYQISVRTYDQTLGALVGIALAPGVRLQAAQSLLNQRNYFLFTGASTVRNRWNLTASLEIDRSLSGGSQIRGAVRHIGAYDEPATPSAPVNEEGYWIAGITFQKQF
jgi:hypothetical protein